MVGLPVSGRGGEPKAEWKTPQVEVSLGRLPRRGEPKQWLGDGEGWGRRRRYHCKEGRSYCTTLLYGKYRVGNICSVFREVVSRSNWMKPALSSRHLRCHQGKKAKRKKVAPVPAMGKKQEDKKMANPLSEKRPKNSGIRRDVPPKRDLTRQVGPLHLAAVTKGHSP